MGLSCALNNVSGIPNVVVKSKHFLFLIRHRSCYSYSQSGKSPVGDRREKKCTYKGQDQLSFYKIITLKDTARRRSVRNNNI